MLLCESLIVLLERDTISHLTLLSHSKKVYKIHNLTDEEATLVEPASCAIHGLDKLNPPVGVDVLIFGAGPTGKKSKPLSMRDNPQM